MKVELFPFQKKALAGLRMQSAEALGSYRRTHSPQVVSFTAPTGAGKTIIMASLIESIYFGDDSYPDQQNAIFVWLSDSPQLNEQSKQKIDLKADKIRLDQCVTITEETFDREVLDDGHIYFLNTQKLGKSSNLTKHSDTRQYTIWETLANTAREKSDRLYKAILMLETEEECYNFFQDLCTIPELRSMEQRYEVATLLNNGLIYNDILERTGASSATISRVNRSLIYGTGGYESVLEKMAAADGAEQVKEEE